MSLVAYFSVPITIWNGGTDVDPVGTGFIRITSSDWTLADIGTFITSHQSVRYEPTPGGQDSLEAYRYVFDWSRAGVSSVYLTRSNTLHPESKTYYDDMRVALFPYVATIESDAPYVQSSTNIRLLYRDETATGFSINAKVESSSSSSVLFDVEGGNPLSLQRWGTITVPQSNCPLGFYSSTSNAGTGLHLTIPFVSSDGYLCILHFNNNWQYGWSVNFGYFTQEDTQTIIDWGGEQPHPTMPDPYTPGGESEPGGGEGDFDDTSDDIDFPPLPSMSAVDAGFIKLFHPSQAQLHSLASYMWSSSFDLDTFRKLFADPMDCILGMSIVPVAVPPGGSEAVKVGNISTGVTLDRAGGQYVEVDCGTLNVNEYWGAYLDYEPYTKAELYLPYVGTHAIAVDDIMGKAVHIKYHVDILSGACCAYVKCGGSVLYTFAGQCSSSVPISGRDWTNVINGVLQIAGAIGSMVATGGATAPMGISTIASAAANVMKPTIEKSGSMGGTAGMMGGQTPYLILTRPKQALPANQNTFTGYPAFITKNLGSVTGYTEIAHIHLYGVPATDSELSEIETLLKEGVIL